jgi:hypothetical protein
MHQSHFHPNRHLLAAALVLLALPTAPALADAGDSRIEGSWINEVKIVACASPMTVLATLTSMETYLRGGAMIEGGGPGTPPPAVSRSAGHGVWERTGLHQIQAMFRTHSLDALGRLVRITEVTTSKTLTRGDNPATVGVVEPYYLSGWGTNKITNIDPVTGAVTSVTQGGNYSDSRPILAK